MPSPDESTVNTRPFIYRSYTVSNGQYSPWTQIGTSVSYSFFRTTVSVRTPGFKSLKRNSNLPINPYSKSIAYRLDPMIPMRLDILSGGQAYINYYEGSSLSIAGCVLTPDAVADDPTQRVVNKIISQISSQKSNLAVTLAEADKTAAMVAKSATRIYKSLKALKGFRFGEFLQGLGLTDITRGNTRNVSAGSSRTKYLRRKLRRYQQQGRINDFVADTWLEFSYGWKPLLNDVYSSAEALSELMIEHSNAVRYVSASARTEGSASRDIAQVSSTWNYHRESKVTRWCRIGVWYSIPSGGANPVDVFGLNNPLEVAWELVPFSFVADWFLPIGNAIRGLTAYSGLNFLKGYKSTRDYTTAKSQFSSSGRWIWDGGTGYVGTGEGTIDLYWLNISRVVLVDFPSVSFPSFKDPRSFAHAASAIALLQSLFLRK